MKQLLYLLAFLPFALSGQTTVNLSPDSTLYDLHVLSGGAITFGLTSTGDGSGVSTLTVTVNKDTEFTVDGNAKFYSDAGGTADESTTWTATTGAARTRYLKCPSGTSNFIISGNNITSWSAAGWGSGWVSSANAASLSGDVSKLTALTKLQLTGNNTLSGDISALTSLTWLKIAGTNILSGSVAGLTSLTRLINSSSSNTMGGDVSGLTSLQYLEIQGTGVLTGSLAGLTSLISIANGGPNTLSGSINALSSLAYLYLIGYNTISCDFSLISASLLLCYISGNNQIDTYTSGATWNNINVTINPSAGYGYDSTEIDNILIDMDNSAVFSGKTITLQGSSAARTAASDAAVTNLIAGGNTIITN